MCICNLRKNLLLFFCWLSLLIIPAGYTIYCYGLLAVSAISIYIKTINRINHMRVTLPAIFLLSFFVFTYFYSDYDINGVIVPWLCLFTSYVMNMYTKKDMKIMNKQDYLENVIWYICLITMVARCIFSDRIGDFNEIVFYTAIGDKNIISWCFFLFCLYGQKRGYHVQWVFLGLYMLLFSRTRSLFLMLIIYGLTLVYVKYSNRKINLKKHNYVFAFFIVTSLIIVIFSYLWINHYSLSSISEYKSSLNDGANRMRFAGNIYAWENILKDNNILFSGYGEDLKEYMGIANDENVRFLGVRLIAPENSSISSILYMGWIPGLVFLWFIGKYVQKYMDYENLPYIIPVLVNSLLVPTLRGCCLVIWLFLIAVPYRKEIVARNKLRKLITNVQKKSN